MQAEDFRVELVLPMTGPGADHEALREALEKAKGVPGLQFLWIGRLPAHRR